MKIYRSQWNLISTLFFGQINFLENKLTILQKRLANPNTKEKSLSRIKQEIAFQTNWLAELKEAYEQFQNEPNPLKDELIRLEGMLADTMKERVKGLEEHTAFMAQMHEVMAIEGLGIEEFLTRQAISIRLSLKHHSN